MFKLTCIALDNGEFALYINDAGIGYNWDSLQAAIDEVNGN